MTLQLRITRAMLDPCPRWRTVTEGDVSYGYCEVPEPPNICDCIDGRPLVELVTDCPECGGSGTIQLDIDDDECEDVECDECDATGAVSLGFVTADKLVRLEDSDDPS